MTCDVGYTASQSDDVTCTETGLWSTRHVECQPVTCNTVNTLRHGTVHYNIDNQVVSSANVDTIPASAVAMFGCRQGYNLHGSLNSTCLVNGTWSNQHPQCQSKFMNKIE